MTAVGLVTSMGARRRPSIVHVAESFASGTASAMTDVVRNYPDADHHLVYSVRPEASVNSSEFDGFLTHTPMPHGTLARIRFLRSTLRAAAWASGSAVLVHAHSSKAGAYVRLAVRNSRRLPIVYTPHCYAFERRDVTWPVRQAFRIVEWLLSFNTAAFGACSPREAALSRWWVRSPRVETIPNVSPESSVRGIAARADGPLRVVGNGRLGPQKAPEFFAAAFAAAAAATPGIEAIWVGAGDADLEQMLRAHGVTVTGWLPRREALEVMAGCDVYLHTALWEGFPVSILEAVGLGLPVVARRGPYLAGVDLPVVIDDAGEFATVLRTLQCPSDLRELRESSAAALSGNNDAEQAAAIRRLYGPLLQRPSESS